MITQHLLFSRSCLDWLILFWVGAILWFIIIFFIVLKAVLTCELSKILIYIKENIKSGYLSINSDSLYLKYKSSILVIL